MDPFGTCSRQDCLVFYSIFLLCVLVIWCLHITMLGNVFIKHFEKRCIKTSYLVTLFIFWEVKTRVCYLVRKTRESPFSASCGCDVTEYSCLVASDLSNSSTGSVQALVLCLRSLVKTQFG